MSNADTRTQETTLDQYLPTGGNVDVRVLVCVNENNRIAYHIPSSDDPDSPACICGVKSYEYVEEPLGEVSELKLCDGCRRRASSGDEENHTIEKQAKMVGWARDIRREIIHWMMDNGGEPEMSDEELSARVRNVTKHNVREAAEWHEWLEMKVGGTVRVSEAGMIASADDEYCRYNGGEHV